MQSASDPSRQKGNAAFAKRDYLGAVQFYNDAIRERELDKTDVAAYSNLAAALLAVGRPGAAAIAGVQAVHEMLHGHLDEETEDAGALKEWRVLCKAAYRGSIGLSWCGHVAAGARLAEFASAAARVASSGGMNSKDIAFESQSKETVRAAAAAWGMLRESSRTAGDGSADSTAGGGPTGTGGGIHTVLMRAVTALALDKSEFKGAAMLTGPKADAAPSSASASDGGAATVAALAGEGEGEGASAAAPVRPLLPGIDTLREARCTALRLERAAAAAAPPAGKAAPVAQFKARSAALEACIGSAWLAGGMASVAVERLEEALARWEDHEDGKRAAARLEEALAPAVQREMIGRWDRGSPEGWKGGRRSLEIMRAVCDCALADHAGAVQRLQRLPLGGSGGPSAEPSGVCTAAPSSAASSSSGAVPKGIGALIAHLQAVIAEKARLGSRFKEASGSAGGDNASMREIAEGYAALGALLPGLGPGPGAGAGGTDAAGWQSALLDVLRIGGSCASFGCNQSVALLRAGDEQGALRAAMGVCRRHPLSERGWHRLANAAAARLAGLGGGGKGPASGASVTVKSQSPGQIRALLCSAVDVLGCLEDYTAPAAGSLPLGKGRASWLAEGVRGEASRRALGKDLAKGRALVTRGGTPAVREVPSDGHFSSVAAAAAATGTVLVVDYHATWCGPCKMLAPHYQALARRLSGPRCQFLKVDGDVCQRTVATAGVRAFPTVHGYWPPSGTRLAELQGADPSALQRVVKEAIERGRAARAKVLSRARAAGDSEGGASPLSKADAEGAAVAGPALADAALVQAVKGALEAAASMGL